MIPLTRLGHTEPFYLNPDLVERIDEHVDTVVRLTNGIEYVVAESAEEIVSLIVDFRIRVNATGPIVTRRVAEDGRGSDRHPSERPSSHVAASERSSDGPVDATVVELPSNREVPR